MKKSLLLGCVASILLFSGCYKRLDTAFDDIHVQTNASVAVGSLSVTDSSIFAMAGVNNQLRPNADGILAFSLNENMELLSDNFFDKIFKFPQQNINFEHDIVGASGVGNPGDLVPVETLAPGGLTIDVPLQIKERVDKITFSDGFIEIFLNNAHGYDFSKLICRLPGLTRDGQVVELRDGQRISFNDGAKYEMTLSQGNVLKIVLAGEIPIMESISGMVDLWAGMFGYLEGYFGRKTVGPEYSNIEVPLDLKNFTDKVGFVYFANPSFNINFKSGLEAPLMLLIEKIEAKMETSPGKVETVVLDFTTTGNRLYMDNKGQATAVINNKSFVEGKDNLSTVLSKGLQSMTLQTSIIINPTVDDIQGLGPNPLPEDQVTNKIDVADKIDGVVNIEIPIDGVISQIGVSNAIEIDFSGLSSESLDFKELAIAFFGTNDLPFDFSLMASAREGDVETGKPTNLFDKAVLIPASNGKKADQPGYTQGLIPTSDMITIKVNTELIKKLSNSKKMFLDISGSTYQADKMTNVSLYSPSKLNLNMLVGVKADFNITPTSSDN